MDLNSYNNFTENIPKVIEYLIEFYKINSITCQILEDDEKQNGNKHKLTP